MGSLNYTPELAKVKRELFQYMEENHLSFFKDYRNDPIHGKNISLFLLKLNKERDKIMEDYPLHDQDNNRKFLTLKTKRSIMSKVKKTKISKAKEATEIVEKKTKKTPNKENKRVNTKYDYPQVDGREMTAAEKKKYRMQMRAKNKEGQDPAPEEASPKEPKKKKKAVKEEED